MAKPVPLLYAVLLAVLPAGAGASVPTTTQIGQDYVDGQRYYTGDGVEQSYERAAPLFRRAAENGHAYAQYSLALMYEHGYGVGKDADEAQRWYRQAAALGHAPAIRRLGLLGEPVPAQPVSIAPTDDSSTAAVSALLPALPAEIPLPGALPAATQKPYAAPRAVGAVRRTLPPAATTPATVTEAPAPAPPAAVAPAPVTALPTVVPEAELPADVALAIRDYQASMASANYPAALRALQDARIAGEIGALGLNEVQSAEALARLAIRANDEVLALTYLRQASALGSAEAQLALDQWAAGAEFSSLAAGLGTGPAPKPAAAAADSGTSKRR